MNQPDRRSRLLERIRAAELEASTLREKRDELNRVAREQIDKRNRLNERRRERIQEAQALKEKRDHLNELVKEHRTWLMDIRTRVQERREEIRRLKGVMREILSGVRIRGDDAQNRIRELDWKIQTSPTSREDEERLVSRIRELQMVVKAHRRADSIGEEIQRLYGEIDNLRGQIASRVDAMKRAVEEAQSHHSQMIQRFRESDELARSADEAHRAFLAVKEEADSYHKRLVEKREEISRLESELRELDSEAKEAEAERTKEVVERVVQEAQRKARYGERMSFEEFKLLIERDLFKSGKKK